jgi:hypothetical protein
MKIRNGRTQTEGCDEVGYQGTEDGGDMDLRNVTTWRHNPQDHDSNLHGSENPKSRIVVGLLRNGG